MWYEIMKEIRERSGMNQTELAEILKSSRPTISRYERGEKYPDISYLIRFCAYFRIDPKYILDKDIKSEMKK